MTVLTSIFGDNSDLIAEVCKLYTKPGDIISDATYGKGVFWKKVDTTLFDFRPTDILTGVDFRNLPYENESLDVVVLDPPYMRRSSAKLREDLDPYHNNDREEIGDNVLQLYFDGIREARRVLKSKGLLWIKCQDKIESGQNKMDHISIWVYTIMKDFRTRRFVYSYKKK